MALSTRNVVQLAASSAFFGTSSMVACASSAFLASLAAGIRDLIQPSMSLGSVGVPPTSRLTMVALMSFRWKDNGIAGAVIFNFPSLRKHRNGMGCNATSRVVSCYGRLWQVIACHGMSRRAAESWVGLSRGPVRRRNGGTCRIDCGADGGGLSLGLRRLGKSIGLACGWAVA